MSVRLEYGYFLKQIREKRSISQDMLAEQSGLLRHQIISIEKGKNNYTIDNLFKYLHGLQINSMNINHMDEIFDFELKGSHMTLNTIREKVADKITYTDAWVNELDHTNPGHYGVESFEVELSSEDVFVSIPQRSFDFKNAEFHFNLNLMSSKDGFSHKDSKVANGSGTFCFSESGSEIEIEELEIEVDLDLMA